MKSFSKFNIGQKVKHKLFGCVGIVIDIDAEYFFSEKPRENDIASNYSFRSSPWYHVIMEDDDGNPVHIYLAEDQITYENSNKDLEKSFLDELSESVKAQFQIPKFQN